MAGAALAEPRARIELPPATPSASPAQPAGDSGDDAARAPINPVRSALVMLAILCITFSVYVAFGSSLQHRAAQTTRFAHFRGQLALGTAPVGPTDEKGHLLALGTSIALLRIPSLGLREVVGEGTTGSVLQNGPGHLRSTVFPGGQGTSVVFGRAHAFGGPFGAITHLRKGDNIVVTTGNGTATFHVVDVRRAGEKIPPLESGSARLTLVTATGTPYLPSGTVSVDADTKTALPSEPPVTSSVPGSERPLGTSSSGLWQLFLWLEALVALAIGAVWVWYRRSPAHALLLFSAPVILVVTEACRALTPMLPNLM